MAKEKHYRKIHGVFKDQSNVKGQKDLVMDTEKLAQLTSEEFTNIIKEDFEQNHNTSKFNAQMIEVNGINSLGDEFRFFEVSLGHWIYSHHYRYWPHDNHWHKTIINQEFFKNIVKPFQSKLNR